MARIESIYYRGMYLGDITILGIEDWKNPKRAPSERDFKAALCHNSQQLLYTVLDRYPLQYHESNPDVPWPIVVTHEICRVALGGKNDKEFEEEVMRQYIARSGMNQLIQIFGGNPTRVLERIDRIKAEDG